jgi:small-conductance mechanosensitive channel
MKTKALDLFRRHARVGDKRPSAFCAILLLTLCMVTPAMGAETTAEALGELQSALVNAVTSHRDELAELKVRLGQMEALKGNLVNEMGVQEHKSASYRQLLLMSQPPLESLEQGIRSNRLGYEHLSEQLEKLRARYNTASFLFLNADDRIALVRKQMDDIPRSRLPDDRKNAMAAEAEQLIDILVEKKALGEAFRKSYEDLAGRLNALILELKALDEKLSSEFEDRKQKMLFTTTNPYRHIFDNGIAEAWTHFFNRIGTLLGLSTEVLHWEQIQRIQMSSWVFFLFWLTAILVLRARSRDILQRLETKHETPQWRFRRLFLFLLRRSLLYLGLTLLFGAYDAFDWPLLDIGLANVLFKIFLVLLLTHWGLDYLKFMHGDASPTALGAYVITRLKRFFRLLRAITLVSILFTWVAGVESVLAWLLRDGLTIVLLVWIIFFWQRAKQVAAEAARQGQAVPDPRKMKLWIAWSYLVSGGAVLISLVGYGTLAGHWWGGWIKSTTLLFWAYVSWNAIEEWRRDPYVHQGIGNDPQRLGGNHRLSWPLIQLCRGLCLIGVARGIVWAWDREGVLFARVTEVLNYTHTIGNLNLNLRGIVHAVVILFFTHIGVHIGRTLLDEKVLGKKALEPGLKDSVITILSYLAWSIGLLLALASVGVNATSLAVVFGALSVGIGFGLQTIFNNFISGLILLFERPIQVGDFVEVNGIWAEVKKINVRATVVQTFDNASVIIPNSEFISQQVTNWSFKDRRMRKNLNVGVAYGTDIDLVAKTLLDIANAFPDVLKFPRPEVLFLDHGDNALIFCLRVWVQVEDSAVVPSKIRFEIDKRFRELGIEIPFPQRDIHIRSIAKELSPATVTEALQGDSAGNSGASREKKMRHDPPIEGG